MAAKAYAFHLNALSVLETHNPLLDNIREEDVQLCDLQEDAHDTTISLSTALPSTHPTTGEKVQRAIAHTFLINVEWLLNTVEALKTATDGCDFIIGSPTEPVSKFCSQHGYKINVYKPVDLGGRGTMHTKLIILFYESCCRVLITSGNLIPKDFERKTQSIFFQEFPVKTLATSVSDFEMALVDYHHHLATNGKCDVSSVVSKLLKYDFSDARANLVTSVPGEHLGKALDKYGYRRIRWLLRDFTHPPQENIFFQCSSLGALAPKDGKGVNWLTEEFLPALDGRTSSTSTVSGVKRSREGEFMARYFTASAAPTTTAPSAAAAVTRPCSFQLIVPRFDTIRDSLEGWAGGASVPIPEDNLTRPGVADVLHMYDASVSGRALSVPHIKTMGSYTVNSAGDDSVSLHWVYTGSHNLSKAAWGGMSAKQGLRIMSYEMGVFVCKEGMKTDTFNNSGKTKTTSKDEGITVPLPFKLPAERFPKGVLPWNKDYRVSDGFVGKDRYGRTRDTCYPWYLNVTDYPDPL